MKDRQRLDKILANSGFGTRKEVKKLIKLGEVTVDKMIVKDGSIHIDPSVNEIIVAGQTLKYRAFIYLMLNKPAGIISATWDNRDKTVIDVVPEEYRHYELFPVGRLDKDTEGLLILTNDGQLSHRLLSPKKHVPKTYYAKIDGKVTDEDIRLFNEGVVIDDGYQTLPAKLKIIKTDTISEIELTIVEGKFHQVKRMFKAVNKEVQYLKRIKMGLLLLDDSLILGECRELSEKEFKQLNSSQKKGFMDK